MDYKSPDWNDIDFFLLINPHLCKPIYQNSIPAYMVGIDEKPFDFVPDAEMPDKLIKLYGKEKDELRKL